MLGPRAVLLGFSFGLPLGLIDAAAMAAVPPTSSGSASGLIQFARLGSETIVIGVYAAVIAALVAARIPDPKLAQDVAAGLPGHATDYIPPFVVGQIAILVAIVVGLIATVVLHRVVRRKDRRAHVPETHSRHRELGAALGDGPRTALAISCPYRIDGRGRHHGTAGAALLRRSRRGTALRPGR